MPPSHCFPLLESEGSDDPTINQEEDESNTFILKRRARYLSGDTSHSSRSHQTDSSAKANVEHLLMQPLQICLMRNRFFSPAPFFVCVNEAGCPSGLGTAGGSAPREQKSDEEEELLNPEQAVRSSSLGRMTHRQGIQTHITMAVACLSHNHTRLLGSSGLTPRTLMCCSLMLWKQMELSHQG